jgi:hypothetical protein
LIDHRLFSWNWVPPSLELLLKMVLQTFFFNKDIEMSYDILYRQEKLWYRDVVWHAISTWETIISIEQLALDHFPLLQPNSMQLVPLRWLASTIPKCTHGFVPGINLVRLWRRIWGWWWGVWRR